MPHFDMIPQATLCFFWKNRDIQKIIENHMGEMRGNIFLFNEILNNIFNFNTPEFKLNTEEVLASVRQTRIGGGIHERTIGGSRHIIMRWISENTGMSIVAINRKEDFYSKTKNTEVIFLTAIIVMGTLVLIFAFIMSKRHYKPINRLLRNMGGGWESKKNEDSSHFRIPYCCRWFSCFTLLDCYEQCGIKVYTNICGESRLHGDAKTYRD
jgi:hypothetical protein